MFSYRNKIRLAVIGIFLIALLAVVINFPEQTKKAGFELPSFLDFPYRLGLDLQGGTHLIYRADVTNIPGTEQADSVEGVRDVIERRVNAFGVAEPVIQTTKTNEDWRIIIELAGIKDVNQAINMIGETPLLEFKEPNPSPIVELTDEEKTELENYNNQAKLRAEDVLVQAQKPDADFVTLALDYSEDQGSAQNGGSLNFASRGLFVPEFETVCFDELNVGEVSDEILQSQFGYHIIKKEDERGEGEAYEASCSHILIATKSDADFISEDDRWLYTGLTGNQLQRAQLEFNGPTQEPQVLLQFNDEGAELFSDITKRNIGRPVAIYLDGQPISTPTVQQEITDGQAVISGRFTVQEARLLAQRLNAGALPVPIELISQQTVGASLGSQSVEKSLKAGIIGLLIVALFMVGYYRMLGVAAVLALLFYALSVLAIFKVIPVTLTLAGIAGFILSLGMAVDANILIFERFKEEIKKEKPTAVAVKEGFKRAWPSIFDGNISTLITCLILMGFTTSLVKGFAVTLSIGILISMFSAMVVTRLILTSLIRFEIFNKPWLLGAKKRRSS